MIKVFDYLDHREFLKDYYTEQKVLRPSFSFQIFAKKAGFKSKSFLPHVIEGKRDLSPESIFKIATALKLESKSFSYFEDLVRFNQAKTTEQKSHFFFKLSSYKKAAKARFIQETQYEYLSNWYHSTLRELITVVDFKGDYSRLGGMLNPPISAKMARDSVQLITKLGLIKKVGMRYFQTNRAITTGDEVRSLTVEKFHKQNLNLATESLSNVSNQERDISCMIVGLSRSGFDTVKTRIQKFRKEIADIVENDGRAESVYHINFQLFPTSRLGKRRK